MIPAYLRSDPVVFSPPLSSPPFSSLLSPLLILALPSSSVCKHHTRHPSSDRSVCCSTIHRQNIYRFTRYTSSNSLPVPFFSSSLLYSLFLISIHQRRPYSLTETSRLLHHLPFYSFSISVLTPPSPHLFSSLFFSIFSSLFSYPHPILPYHSSLFCSVHSPLSADTRGAHTCSSVPCVTSLSGSPSRLGSRQHASIACFHSIVVSASSALNWKENCACDTCMRVWRRQREGRGGWVGT